MQRGFWIKFGSAWLIVIVLCISIYIFMPKKFVKYQSDTMITTMITPTAIPEKPFKIIGWIPYWDQTAAYQSFSDHAELFDAVGFFWYYLKPDGTIGTYKNAAVELPINNIAHKKNVKTMAVLTNMPDYTEINDNWDWQRVDQVISSEKARSLHISDIVSLVENNGFDGLDLDYEALQAHQRDDFSGFIHSLGLALHGKQKLLGVAIHPKTSEDNPNENNGSHAQDWQSIANDADMLYFMTYTEHYKESLPGSSGSLPWTKKVIDYAVTTLKIPPEKIFLGIGLFGLEWVELRDNWYEGISDDATYKYIQSIINTSNAKTVWDNTVKSIRLEYIDKSGKHVIWYDDARSVAARIELAKEYSLGGVGFWRLGGEDKEIWDIFSYYPSQQKE